MSHFYIYHLQSLQIAIDFTHFPVVYHDIKYEIRASLNPKWRIIIPFHQDESVYLLALSFTVAS